MAKIHGKLDFEFLGVFNRVRADGEATEGGQIGAGAELLADVCGESADVGAAAHFAADFEFGIVV